MGDSRANISMHEIRVLQTRLLVFGLCALVMCGFIIYYALREDGLAVAGISLALIYVSLRAGHFAREIAKVSDRIEREDRQSGGG